MIIIGKKILKEFEDAHADIRIPLQAWVSDVESSQWSNPNELKERYRSASILGGNKVVFNIKGNHYRILVEITYKNGIVFVEKIGTHQEYDKWNCK
jgi:mRNA interferase HigB